MVNRNNVRISIFTRITIFFCVLVLVLMGISYTIYKNGIEIINGEVKEYNAILLNSLSDNLTNEFKRILTLQYELADNWDLMKLGMELGDLSSYERSQAILRIRDKLNAIKTSSQLIDEIRIILPEIETVISTGSAHQLTDVDRSFIADYGDMPSKQIIIYEHQILMIAEYPQLYYERGMLPKFIISASISDKLLDKYIDSQNVAKSGDGFIYDAESGLVLGNDNKRDIHLKIMNYLKQLNNADDSVIRVELDNIVYHVYSTALEVNDINLIRYVKEDIIYSDLDDYKKKLWIFIFVTFIGILLFSKSLYGMIHTPLKKLVKAFEQVVDTDDVVLIHHPGKDEFNYIYESFNEMSIRLHNLVDQVLKQTILAQKSELKHLQSQINPHFLYNSFLTLSNRIEMGDIEFASRFSAQLAKFFMYVTRNKKDMVSLEEEVAHAKNYAEIQYARFRNRLQLEFDPLPIQFTGIQVPRIILQPILENAFDHALEKNDTDGVLYMSFEDYGTDIEIVIEDNGSNLGEGKLEEIRNSLEDLEREVTGIINIHRRLALRFGGGAGLTLKRSLHGGLEVRLKIPKGGEAIV